MSTSDDSLGVRGYEGEDLWEIFIKVHLLKRPPVSTFSSLIDPRRLGLSLSYSSRIIIIFLKYLAMRTTARERSLSRSTCERGPQSPLSCLSLVHVNWACLSSSYILASHWSSRIEGRVCGEVVTPGQVSLNVPTKNQIRHKALGIFKLQPQ